MRMMLHICCGNCAFYPVSALRARGIKPSGLWFNPNIHPAEEYALRLNALREYQTLSGLEIRYIDYYGEDEFKKRLSKFAGEIRCAMCYEWRLNETARIARESGMDAFSTTLLYSIYQQHELIKSIGEEAGIKHGIRFHCEDFRPGWAEGRAMSRESGIYRQRYCGCYLSKQEREAGKKTRQKAGV